jgi:DNA-binding NarL/FixJ family response regulator
MKRITVLLAEDHAVVREGLRALLDAEADIEVVGEAKNGHQAALLARKLRPAVVVMDIAMPRLNGLEAARQILKAVPATKVILLSAYSGDEYVEKVNEIGVAGYLLKQDSLHALVKGIREVHKGNRAFSPSVSDRLRRLGRKQNGGEGLSNRNVARLTSREVEVLQLIAEGEGNKGIAAELGISIKTVEKHRQRLMERLDIHDTAGLTRYAIAAGIISSSSG